MRPMGSRLPPECPELNLKNIERLKTADRLPVVLKRQIDGSRLIWGTRRFENRMEIRSGKT